MIFNVQTIWAVGLKSAIGVQLIPRSLIKINNLYIIHRVEDVTEFIKANSEQIRLNEELLDKTARIESEIYRNTRALRTRDREITNIFEYAPIGMATVSLSGYFIDINQSFCKILAYSKPELLQLRFHDITHPDDLGNDLKNLEALLADEIQTYRMEKRYIRKDTSIVWVQLTVSLLRNEVYKPINYIAQVEDITEKIKVKETLFNKAQALKRSNDALDEFAYIASHDLKEPLRGISNYSSFLMEDYADKLDAEGKSQLKTLQKLSGRLESLLNNLLIFSRVSRIDMALTKCDLNTILADKTQLLETYLNENNATIEIVKSLPEVICDHSRIGQVFQNLITNAVKYNENRTKQIVIDYLENEEEFIFSVKDNGIGISQEHYETIFKIFRRLHGRDEYGGGTGSGLTLAKKIIERHDGNIWLESEKGMGSTFYFSISKNTSMSEAS